MKARIIAILTALLLSTLPAAEDPWAFGKGQVFIGAYAGFLQTQGEVNMDTLYDLCIQSSINRNISLGFSYMQRQSQASQEEEPLRIDLGATYQVSDIPSTNTLLSNTYISSKLYTLEGEYHFTQLNVRHFDVSAGAGLGLEYSKNNSINFQITPNQKNTGAQLNISNSNQSRYYPTAHFFANARYYLVQNLAISLKGGYQYSGISGYHWFLGLGVSFRIK